MGYTLKGLDKLEIKDGFRYIPNELDAFEGDTFKGKVHSSQLLPKKEIKLKDNFELREKEKDTINIRELSIYKSNMIGVIDTMSNSLISFRFIIPAFQRGYRWETKLVRELLDDIYINYKKYYNHDSPEETESYCIQPLVLKQSTKNNFLYDFRVIDGQQRLTTITLLLEALNNQVPEDYSFHAFIPIFYEERPESEKFLYNVGELCKNAIESVKENSNTPIPLEERVTKTIEHIEEPEDLNSRYMLNTYLYAYWYFWEIITGNRKDYFTFIEDKWRKDEQWEPKRFVLIVKMLLKATSVIWYTIDNDETDEHKVFRDFNSGKISLTGSELVKGVFMNPDNYIHNYGPEASSLYKQLVSRQTMLGGQWDDMEKALHNDEFWSFVPHQEDGKGEIDKSTHIDSIINMYAYFNIMNGKGTFDVGDVFNIINDMIKNRQETINEMITKKQATDEDKFNSMEEIWLEIMNVYTTFHEWFIGDNTLRNVNSLYHRISLLKRLSYKPDDNYKRRYQAELVRMHSLYNKLTICKKTDREKYLSIEIAKKLLETDKSNKERIKTHEPNGDDIENFIKTTTYDENPNGVEGILLALNLSTLEGAQAYGGRFPFDIFDKQEWQKEHIFATRTELPGENNEGEELYKALVSENEMYSYDEYHKQINEPVKESYEKTIEAINSIINDQVSGSDKDNLNTRLLGNDEKDGDILNILRDNHMGNMALLIGRNNKSISNDSYKDKSKKISKRFKEGDFIPICTMNVFSGFYSDDDGYSIHWLYAKRLSYINQMIKSVKKYLFGDEAAGNEDSKNG